MRNSRKYTNSSINASRNIFTSIDSTPSALTKSGDLSGIGTVSITIPISGINSPTMLAVTTGNGIFSASHTLSFYKNNVLTDSFTVSSRISSNRLLSQQFENNDVLTITAASSATVSYTLNVKSLLLNINNLIVDNVSTTVTVNLSS